MACLRAKGDAFARREVHVKEGAHEDGGRKHEEQQEKEDSECAGGARLASNADIIPEEYRRKMRIESPRTDDRFVLRVHEKEMEKVIYFR